VWNEAVYSGTNEMTALPNGQSYLDWIAHLEIDISVFPQYIWVVPYDTNTQEVVLDYAVFFRSAIEYGWDGTNVNKLTFKD
jgi:hypothetical protein